MPTANSRTSSFAARDTVCSAQRLTRPRVCSEGSLSIDDFHTSGSIPPPDLDRLSALQLGADYRDSEFDSTSERDLDLSDGSRQGTARGGPGGPGPY
eukprot:538647-Rhodomonas_salina.3